MRPAYKQKNPTISNVKSLDFWSEWRESNSRPLEPHSSALPKLRYTRISRPPPYRSVATGDIIRETRVFVNSFLKVLQLFAKRADVRYFFFVFLAGAFTAASASCARRSLSFSKSGFRYWPVKLPSTSATCSGVPSATMRGKVENGQIVKADGPLITSQCIRVPVLDGHTAAVFVNFKQKPTKEELIQALVEFKGAPQELGLPNAPKQFIQYLEEDDRPQVALDVNYENGFGVSIGRLRKDAYFDWKFVGLSHNTVRGAAGGAVLMAELLKAKGYITAK